jgi:hypothetical protein
MRSRSTAGIPLPSPHGNQLALDLLAANGLELVLWRGWGAAILDTGLRGKKIEEDSKPAA